MDYTLEEPRSLSSKSSFNALACVSLSSRLGVTSELSEEMSRTPALLRHFDERSRQSRKRNLSSFERHQTPSSDNG